MNFYGLPEFIAYSMLLGIAYVLISQKKEVRLRYWLIGWTLILLHSAIFMLVFQRYPFDVIARGTLMAAGQAFTLAAYHQDPKTPRPPQLLGRTGFSAVSNLIFIVASAIYADSNLTNPDATPFYLLIVIGVVSTVWLTGVDRSKSERRFRVSVALTMLTYAIQAALLFAYGPVMASQWLMCWTYLAVAYFFLSQGMKPTLGLVFTALSFVLWGLVFPVYSLLLIYAPEISNHIESEVWNLPKFLAAASMILALLEERIVSATHLATHDELTGLANRRLYIDRVEQAVANAVRNRAKFGFIIIDLDKFKLVNDTLGHLAGDELLKAVSDRFRSVLRRVDTLARTGGDEFTVVVEGVRSVEEVELVGEALQKSLESAIVLSVGPYRASASVGSALYPNDGTTLTLLQAVADERMYDCKERRRGRTIKRPPIPESGDLSGELGLVPT